MANPTTFINHLLWTLDILRSTEPKDDNPLCKSRLRTRAAGERVARTSIVSHAVAGRLLNLSVALPSRPRFRIQLFLHNLHARIVPLMHFVDCLDLAMLRRLVILESQNAAPSLLKLSFCYGTNFDDSASRLRQLLDMARRI
jgi:hypothetical protein